MILTWDLWTPDIVRYEGRLLGGLQSISGPKTFYRIRKEDKKYLAIIDENRNVIVSILDEETDKPVYQHEMTKEGHKIAETLQDAGVDMGFKGDSDDVH